MKRPSFFEGVMVAIAASVVGAVVFTALATVLSSGFVLRWVIAGLGLAYVIYLLSRSRERVGRVTVLASWLLATVTIWFFSLPLVLYAIAHIGLIWLIRSLYFYSGVLPALADMGLSALGFAAAVWAGTVTHSVLLSIWCFFLVQALFVAIPERVRSRGPTEPAARDEDDRFEQAHRVAEVALRKFTTNL